MARATSSRPRTPRATSSARSRRVGPVIAIDGPDGSGKSTVARGVARALGLRRLDTGAMYRALTLEALRRGIDPADGRRLAALARRLRFDLGPSGLLVNGRRAGRAIRAPEVSAAVSEVSAHAPVRRELVRRQREMIRPGGVVAEGRDIGTVVSPDADLKVFLTASPAERARRRHEELGDAGVRVGYATLKRDLERRDALDSSRPVSPLKSASDAHLIDSTGLSQRQVVAEVVRLAREKRPRGRRAR